MAGTVVGLELPGSRGATVDLVDTPLRRTLSRFLRHRLAVVGLAVISVLVVASALGSTYASTAIDLTRTNLPPSSGHWLGTDALGRDVLSRMLVGGRVTLLVGIVGVSFATLLGGLVGALAGYYRRLDFALMRLVDMLMAFPAIILLLIAVALVGPGLLTLMVMIGLVTWTVPCRIVRGQFLQLRDADFVVAARTIGVRDVAIAVRHILPNALAPIIVYITLAIADVVIFEAGLSFIGLGIQPPTPSWGNMLNAANSLTVLSQRPWQWVPPAAMIVMFVLAVNFVGDGLRDALDPRARADR
jgi:peptide/nickel transport system permease protein